jgi:hypothetical protein
LRRLRQPRYLLGALVVVGYFGLAFGRPAWQATHEHAGMLLRPQALAAIAALAAVLVVAAVFVPWLLPSQRSVLRFNEAEIDFLFPAPLSRVALVNFGLVRVQLAVFASAFLLSLLFGRGRGLPGNALQHATALWLLMATLQLHALGASFTHARLAERGGRPWAWRLGIATLLVGVLVACLAAVAVRMPPPPALSDPAGAGLFLQWALQLVDTAPLSWLLAPGKWLAAPLVRGGEGWWRALLPALAILAAHYYWVVRANVSFEEAAIAGAQRRAAQTEAMRAGKLPFRLGGRHQARGAPFALAANGPVAIAFLWQGLVGAGGGFWRARNLVLVAAASAGLVVAITLSPWQSALDAVARAALVCFGLFTLLGAMFMQRRLREVLALLDIYKSAPLLGWQIALGHLLTPALISLAGQWFALGLAAACRLLGPGHALGVGIDGWGGLVGAMLVAPPLAALLMCIPFAWILWFPAWASALGSRGGGMEAAGQRMIFSFVYLLGAAVSLAPALALGALLAWGLRLAGLPATAAIILGALVACATLLLELVGVLRLLGSRIDSFDLSSELR